MSGSLAWSDFARLAWQRTPYGQFTFERGPVELTLLEPDYTGRAELMVQAVTPRKMSQRSIHFEVPVAASKYNEAIELVERWHSVQLPELKWTGEPTPP